MTALVISRVQYCLTVYGNGSQTNFDRLQKIINFAARVIFGRQKFDHVSDLRDLLGWMPPKFMADYHALITARKVTKHGEPEALASLFTSNSDARDRSTRQDHHFHLPRPRLETGKRRFGYRAAVLLNRLPADAVELSTARFARVHISQLYITHCHAQPPTNQRAADCHRLVVRVKRRRQAPPRVMCFY